MCVDRWSLIDVACVLSILPCCLLLQVKRFFMNFPEDIKYLTAHMKEAGTDEDGAVVRNTNDFVDDIFTR